jgi:hypothetical protein
MHIDTTVDDVAADEIASGADVSAGDADIRDVANQELEEAAAASAPNETVEER